MNPDSDGGGWPTKVAAPEAQTLPFYVFFDFFSSILHSPHLKILTQQIQSPRSKS